MGEHSPRFVSHRSLRPPSSTWRGRFRESKRFVRNNSFPQLWLIFQRQIFVRLIELREEATWQKFKRTLKQEVQLSLSALIRSSTRYFTSRKRPPNWNRCRRKYCRSQSIRRNPIRFR